MSYATKYYIDFADTMLNKYRVLLKQRDYSGAATELTAGATPCVFDFSNKDKFDPISAQLMKVELLTQSGFNLLSIFSADTYEWQVECRLDFLATNQLLFQGWIAGIKGQEKLTGQRQSIEITALCGLAQLENELFQKTDGSPYVGLIQKREILQLILLKTGLSLPYAISTTYINAGNGNIETLSPYVNASAYYKDDGQAMKCSEILEDILGQINAEVFQKNGVWQIRSILLCKQSTYSYYKYSPEGAFLIQFSFDNTPISVGTNSTFKTTSDSAYNGLLPVNLLKASIKLGRFLNKLPNGNFALKSGGSLVNWINTLPYSEYGGSGAIKDPFSVRVTTPVINPSDYINIAEFYIYRNDLKNALTSNPFVPNFDVFEFRGQLKTTGDCALALRFRVRTNKGDYYLLPNGSFDKLNDRTETEIVITGTPFHLFYSDFLRQEGAGRVGVPVWTKITKEIDLSFFGVNKSSRGPRPEVGERFELQGLEVLIHRPFVRRPPGISTQEFKIANFELIGKRTGDIAKLSYQVTNELKSPSKEQSFEFLTGDYFDVSEKATTYLDTQGQMLSNSTAWSNANESPTVTGPLLKLMLTERAKQYSRSYVRIEGSILGRKTGIDLGWENKVSVQGFSGKTFKFVRLAYDVKRRSSEFELQEII